MYKIIAYIPVETDMVYNSFDEAKEELEHLTSIETDTIYRIVEVDDGDE